MVQADSGNEVRQRTMRAIVNDRHGSPDELRLAEVPVPELAADGVLVRVRAASVNPFDWHFMRGEPLIARPVFGIRRPKRRIPGLDVAGVVEAVGPEVSGLAPGDEVFGAGISGSFAEYATATANDLARKPACLSFEQAAAMPIAGCTALQALRDHADVQPGQRVLVNGASGGVGTFAVQIAKAHGAEVTAVCSGRNVELVRSIGADAAIDYEREDFTARDERYDVVVDLVRNHGMVRLRRLLTPSGTLVLVGGHEDRTGLRTIGALLEALVVGRIGERRVAGFIAKIDREQLEALAELAEAGTLSPVVDCSYPLEQAPDAVRHLETMRARGKVVVTV
jgi:NADPH:quinone reductase-like Zn-dependent oxidoreductase